MRGDVARELAPGFGWRVRDRVALLLVLLGFLLTALWFAFPSALFIRPISLDYDLETERFRFVREVNPAFCQMRETAAGSRCGHPARWWAEITLIEAEEFECHSGGRDLAFYQIVPGNTVVYNLGAWAQRCLGAGPPFYVTTYRQVLLWGWLPLRPSMAISEITGERDKASPRVVPAE